MREAPAIPLIEALLGRRRDGAGLRPEATRKVASGIFGNRVTYAAATTTR